MEVEIEVTFRRGNRRGEPIGVEIITPHSITLAAVNRVFRDLGLPPLKKTDIAPLLAA